MIVYIEPLGACSAGAQWRVDEGLWHDSGYGNAQTGLSVGSHTVSFNIVTGWITPDNHSVTINANQTTMSSGLYGEGCPWGCFRQYLSKKTLGGHAGDGKFAGIGFEI